MEQWILAVGYDENQFAEAQQEWLNYGVFIRMVTDMQSAVRELSIR